MYACVCEKSTRLLVVHAALLKERLEIAWWGGILLNSLQVLGVVLTPHELAPSAGRGVLTPHELAPSAGGGVGSRGHVGGLIVSVARAPAATTDSMQIQDIYNVYEP